MLQWEVVASEFSGSSSALSEDSGPAGGESQGDASEIQAGVRSSQGWRRSQKDESRGSFRIDGQLEVSLQRERDRWGSLGSYLGL